MGNSTTELLALALKEQLRTTPLDRVTVSGLAARAGITRQTFYYHFSDTYDLATYVFEQEVANHILEHASYDEWASGYLTLLRYLRDNFEQTRAILDSLGHRERDAFFLRQFRIMMRAIVDELIGDLRLSPEDLRFVVDHYAAIVLGHFLRWMSEGARDDPAELVPKIEKALRGTVRATLERFAEEDPRMREPRSVDRTGGDSARLEGLEPPTF